MNTQTAYEKFLLKTESNSSNNNIVTDRGRFVLIFNEAQNKLIELLLERRNENDILQIQKLLVPYAEISDREVLGNLYTFTLPSNYFDAVSAKAIASKGDCTNKEVSLFQIKPENASELMQDFWNKPSFEFREAPFYYSQQGVSIFVDNFSINKVVLTYYRKPVQIALADEENPEGAFSTANPEFSDELVDRILSIAASESDINTNNNRFQLQRQRALAEV